MTKRKCLESADLTNKKLKPPLRYIICLFRNFSFQYTLTLQSSYSKQINKSRTQCLQQMNISINLQLMNLTILMLGISTDFKLSYKQKLNQLDLEQH